METFDLLFIAPICGIVIAQLVFESLVEFVNIFLYLIGIFKHQVPFKDNFSEMLLSIGSSVLYLVLVAVGLWFLTEKMHYHWTDANKLMCGVFAIFSALYAIPRMNTKWRKTWREATVPHVLEQRRSHMEHEKEI